jgi:hypothetical protein
LKIRWICIFAIKACVSSSERICRQWWIKEDEELKRNEKMNDVRMKEDELKEEISERRKIFLSAESVLCRSRSIECFSTYRDLIIVE